MKRFISTLLAAFVLIASATDAVAQKKWDKGTITYEITEVKSQEPMMGMMKGSTFGFSFDDDKVRMDMDMMGGMMAMKMVMQGTEKAPIVLMDMMGQKIQLDVDDEDVQENATQFDPADMDLSDLKVTYVDGTKEIAGYKCRTANVTAEGQTFQVYTTNKITFEQEIAKKFIDHFGGFPLGVSVNAEGNEIVLMAKTVESKVSGDRFKLSTEGYQKMTPEEFGKQMGGGFGF